MKAKLVWWAKQLIIVLLLLAIVVSCGFGFVWMVKSAIKDFKGPTKQEVAAEKARISVARQQKLEEIADNATVGNGTAFIPIWVRSWPVDGGGYFYIYANDIVPITDIFCRKHNVRVIGAPNPVGGDNLSGYTIYFERK